MFSQLPLIFHHENLPLTCLTQYVKDETQTVGPKGKEARATRLITEYASRRIGEMAFSLAKDRPRKVGIIS